MAAWSGAEVASSMTMIMNFPYRTKAATSSILPDKRRRGQRQGKTAGGLAASNVNVKATEQRPLSVTSPMDADGESNKLWGLTNTVQHRSLLKESAFQTAESFAS